MSVSIDDFIAYALRWEPEFQRRIRGATMREIYELIDLVGVGLSEIHEQFLLRMGHGDGGLHLGEDGTLDITEVTGYYRRRILRGENNFAPNCVVFAVGTLDLNLSLEEVPGREDPRVVFSSYAQVESLCAESLSGYLFRNAFNSFRLTPNLKRLAFTSSYRDVGMRQVVSDIRQSLFDLGFSVCWFSDSICVCGERGNVLVRAHQLEQNGVYLLVCSADAESAERVGRPLADKFNLKYIGYM